MTDSNSTDHLSRFFDGEMEPSELDDVARTLEQSPADRAILTEFERLSRCIQDLPKQNAPSALKNQVLAEIQQPNGATFNATVPAAPTPHSPPRSRQIAVLLVSLLATATGLMVMIDPPSVSEPQQRVGQLADRGSQSLADAHDANSSAADAVFGMGAAALPTTDATEDGDQSRNGTASDVASVVQACQQADGRVVVIEIAVADVSMALQNISRLKGDARPDADDAAPQTPLDPGWSQGIYLQAEPKQLASTLRSLFTNSTYQGIQLHGSVDANRVRSQGLDLASLPVGAMNPSASRGFGSDSKPRESVAPRAAQVADAAQNLQLRQIPVRMAGKAAARRKVAAPPGPRSNVANKAFKRPAEPALPGGLDANRTEREKRLVESHRLTGVDSRGPSAKRPLRVVLVFRAPLRKPDSPAPR